MMSAPLTMVAVAIRAWMNMAPIIVPVRMATIWKKMEEVAQVLSDLLLVLLLPK